MPCKWNLPRKLTLLSKCLLQQLRIFLRRPIHELYSFLNIQCLWKQMYWTIFRLLPTHQWNLDFRSLLSMPILHWRRKRMSRMVNWLKFMRQIPQLWRLVYSMHWKPKPNSNPNPHSNPNTHWKLFTKPILGYYKKTMRQWIRLVQTFCYFLDVWQLWCLCEMPSHWCLPRKPTMCSISLLR